MHRCLLIWAFLSVGATVGSSIDGTGGPLRRAQVAEIVGGTQASHSDYPYFVSLTQGCGGTLVSGFAQQKASYMDPHSAILLVV